MTVRLDGEIIWLEGRCHVEDAEPLLGLVQTKPGRNVDCSKADTLHSAVIQVLIASASPVVGDSPDDFIRRWVAPAFTKVQGRD